MGMLDRDIFLARKSLEKVKEDWLKKKGEKILENLKKFEKYLEISENVGREYAILFDKFLRCLAIYEKSFGDFLEEYIFFLGFVESFLSTSKLLKYNEELRDEALDSLEKAKESYFRMRYYFKRMIKSFLEFEKSLKEITEKKRGDIIEIKTKFEKAINDLKRASRYLQPFKVILSKIDRIYKEIILPIENIQVSFIKIKKRINIFIKNNEKLLKVFLKFMEKDKPIVYLNKIFEKYDEELAEKYRKFIRKIFINSYGNLVNLRNVINEISLIREDIYLIGIYFGMKNLSKYPIILKKIRDYIKELEDSLRELYSKIKERKRIVRKKVEIEEIIKAFESYNKDILGILDIIRYINSLIEKANENNFERYYEDILNAISSLKAYDTKKIAKEYDLIISDVEKIIIGSVLDVEKDILEKISEDIEILGFLISLVRIQRRLFKKIKKVEIIEERLKRYFKGIEEIEKIEAQERRIKKYEDFLLDLERRYSSEVERLNTLKKEVSKFFKKVVRIYPKEDVRKLLLNLRKVTLFLRGISSKITPIETKAKRILKRGKFTKIREKINIIIKIDDIESIRKSVYKVIKSYSIIVARASKEDFGIYTQYIVGILKEREKEIRKLLIEILRFLFSLKSKQG